MELRIFCEPQQGASYDDILALARTAEESGFGAFFRSDHYLKMGSVSGLPGPTDAWTTLAALARDTRTIRLGTLVTAGTFRLPGPLAIAVAQVDQMSGGRVELGLGAGWYEQEHVAYGVPFPPLRERFERLEEQLAVITGLWECAPEDTFSFSGRHYALSESPALPKPLQSPRPPIVIGGFGQKVTPRLAAIYADEYNVPFAPADVAAKQLDVVRGACEAHGRDPATLAYSVAQVVCCAASDQEFSRRAANIGRDDVELRANGLAGSPEEIVERIGRFEELGASRIYLQILDMADLDHVREIADSVMKSVA
jgi:F420-dependent oxidoreductase-like protein